MRTIALPKSYRGREVRNPSLSSGRVVVFDDVMAIGSVRKFESEHLSIELGLLQPIGCCLIRRFRLNDREREVPRVPKKVVHSLRRLTHKAGPHRNNSAVCNASLLGNAMRIVVPARRLELRDHVLPTSISFAHTPRS